MEGVRRLKGIDGELGVNEIQGGGDLALAVVVLVGLAAAVVLGRCRLVQARVLADLAAAKAVSVPGRCRQGAPQVEGEVALTSEYLLELLRRACRQ